MRKGANIYKRKDGRWEARVRIGRRANGSPKYKSLYAGTYQIALQKKKEFEQAIADPSWEAPPGEGFTFGEAAARWLEDSQNKWKPSSYVRYQNCLEKNILPQWGARALRELRQEDYDALLDGLKGRLKDSSIHTLNAVIKGIVRYSLSVHYLKKNPFDLFHTATAVWKPDGIEILTAEEIDKIIRYIEAHPEPMTLGILIALYEGVRLGELCALQWKDVDADAGVLHIRKTLQRLRCLSPEPDGPKTSLCLGMPKNGRERTIPIHPAVREILRNYLGEAPAEHYVLRDHRPMEPRSVSRNFKRILEQAGIRNINFHALRHTFASCCAEAGMDIKVLSEILGHSSVKITMDRYVHLSMQYKQSQMESLSFPFFSSVNRHKNGQAPEKSRIFPEKKPVFPGNGLFSDSIP